MAARLRSPGGLVGGPGIMIRGDDTDSMLVMHYGRLQAQPTIEMVAMMRFSSIASIASTSPGVDGVGRSGSRRAGEASRLTRRAIGSCFTRYTQRWHETVSQQQ